MLVVVECMYSDLPHSCWRTLYEQPFIALKYLRPKLYMQFSEFGPKPVDWQ